jgi:hypothetical protein
MRKLSVKFMERFPSTEIIVYEIVNNFFGTEITVSGLLTGRDIIEQVSRQAATENLTAVFIPENAFRDEGAEKDEHRVMLDNTTLDELEARFGVPVKIGAADGGRFYRQLAGGI